MDRLLVLPGPVAIANGHRVEVTEGWAGVSDEPVVLALIDVDTGVRYRRVEEPEGEVSRWIGRVLDCTVVMTTGRSRTELLVDPLGPGTTGARVALRGADAAAEAAKAEADRWGGTDRPPAEEPERFW